MKRKVKQLLIEFLVVLVLCSLGYLGYKSDLYSFNVWTVIFSGIFGGWLGPYLGKLFTSKKSKNKA